MKKVELKRIAEYLWKGTPPDEKTPFAHTATNPAHGSIEKKLEAGDGKKQAKEFSDKDDDKIEGPMSIPRKLCFALSFNVWILYFLMMGWVIPCRNSDCGGTFASVMEKNLTSISPLPDLETFNVKGLPSLAMLGYTDGPVWKLAAIKPDDGTFEWHNNLTFIPRRIQCKFETLFDVNRDGIGDCLLTGYYDVYAFNASNGFAFWQRNLPSDEGNIVSGFHPTTQFKNTSYLIGTCGEEMVVLDAQNGKKVAEVEFPCSSPIDIRIVPNAISANFTFWSIVCDYGDKVEAWSFEENDLLNGGYPKSTSNNATAEFELLFRRESDSGGSIDLGSDVTPIPGGPLLLSWSDRVAMVTQNAIAWERRFTYPISVESIKVGHFTDAKELQIAVAARNDTNSVVYILEVTNGTTVGSVMLNYRDIQTVEKIPGDTDSLIVKSVITNFTSYPLNDLSDPIPAEKTNFVQVHFDNRDPNVKEIVTTAKVVGSAVNLRTNKEADLLILTIRNGNAFFNKYILERGSKEDGLFCMTKVNHKTHFSSEM